MAALSCTYMTDKKISAYMIAISKKRHAKKTPEERSAYAKMMVQKREEKRAARRAELDAAGPYTVHPIPEAELLRQAEQSREVDALLRNKSSTG